MTKRHTQLTTQDLRFYPTENLTDSDDGGGLMVRDPLTGADNELFNPVSDQDRTIGRFSARSVHAAVRRPDAAKLGGAHVIISKPAKAANVSHLLYRGVRYGERRKDIIKRIAAYAVYTIESKMTLLSTQSLGSRIVQAYQRTDEALPLVGDVYCLRQVKKGYPTEEQYIQVIRVSSENRTFTTPDGKDFIRAVVKMETSTALTADFIGADYPSITHADPPCLLMETHISDSASYYGVKPLVEAIRANTQTIRLPSIMEKLVPTSQLETPLIDYTAAGQRQLIFDAAKGESVLTAYNAINDSTVLHAGNAITPGSLRLTTNHTTISVRGGTLYRGDTAVGTVDYARGELRFSETLSSGGVWTLYFRPAAELLQVADTASIPVLINNRSYNYVLTILPVPAPGSLQVSYRAQGRWYDLRDDGSGALRGGSSGHGSGTLNYRTGSVSLTCGEMRDVGSEVLF